MMEMPERYWDTEQQRWVYPSELPPLPEMDVYHDDHPYGGGPESFSEEAMRAYGESCARMAREEERERIEASEVVQFLYGAGELDGVGYSEVPTGKPRYWWRSILRATIKGLSCTAR